MKDFQMTFSEEGAPIFFDSADKAVFKTLMSAIRNASPKGNPQPAFVMNIRMFEVVTTNKQRLLFSILVDAICKETGNDFGDVEQSLLDNYSQLKKPLENFTNSEFSALMEKSIIFCNEFLGFNVTINTNGHIEIKNI